MPNQRDSNPDDKNVFDPGFLDELEEEDEPLTAGEAVGGPFGRVFQLDENSWGLFRSWESPKRGDEPFGVVNDLGVARVAAAFLPHVSRRRTIWSRRLKNGKGQTLYRGDQVIGNLRCNEPEVIEALNLGISVASSIESIAMFLRSVGAAAAGRTDLVPGPPGRTLIVKPCPGAEPGHGVFPLGWFEPPRVPAPDAGELQRRQL